MLPIALSIRLNQPYKGIPTYKQLARAAVISNELQHSMKRFARRSQAINATLISYSGIMKWSGIRRADIGQAMQILIAWELIKVADELAGSKI